MRITRKSSSSSIRPTANDSTNPAASETSCTLGPLLLLPGLVFVTFRLERALVILRATREPVERLRRGVGLRLNRRRVG